MSITDRLLSFRLKPESDALWCRRPLSLTAALAAVTLLAPAPAAASTHSLSSSAAQLASRLTSQTPSHAAGVGAAEPTITTTTSVDGRVGDQVLAPPADVMATPAFGVQSPTRAQVQAALDQLVAAGAPAVSAVIQGPGGIERYSAGLANVRVGTPVSTADHFRIGSVTKTFVATIVLRLVAQGKLRLSDTVQRWLPGLVPNGSQITIRELLNHSSGIADYCSLPTYPTLCGPRGSAMTKRWTQQQLVRLGASAGPTFPPGKGWAYSNTGYVLLGMIIERATGRSLAQELQRQIYRPLGLQQSSFPTATAVPRPYSHGYDVSANGDWPLDVTATSPTIAWGAGAMVSTLGNLATFMQAVMSAHLFPRGLLKQMQTATPLSLSGSEDSLGPQYGSYGYGLIHYTWAAACGVYGNSGDFPGYSTVALATASGTRGAALSITSDTLTSAGALGYVDVERLVACRMRFGRIGS